MLLACGAAAPAFAEIAAYGAVQGKYDSNLFRQSSAQADGDGSKRWDIMETAIAGTRGQVQSGEWTGTFDLSGNRNWFSENKFLNNTGFNGLITAAKTGQIVTFDGSGSFGQSLTSFGDLQARLRNVQRLAQANGRLGIGLTSEIRAVFDGLYVRSTNSSQQLQSQDYRQIGGSAGFGWFTPLGNSIVLKASRTQAKGLHDRLITLGIIIYNDPIRYTDSSGDIEVDYHISPITELKGSLSYLSRNDKSQTGSSFHGIVGSGSLIYAPRNALQVTLTAGRKLDTGSLIFVDAVHRTYVTAEVKDAISDFFQVTLDAGYERRVFNYNPTFLPGTLARKDQTPQATATLQYTPLRNLFLSLAGHYEHRTSSTDGFGYGDKSVTLQLQYVFGSPNLVQQ